jgi:hypothetical protein
MNKKSNIAVAAKQFADKWACQGYEKGQTPPSRRPTAFRPKLRNLISWPIFSKCIKN